MAFKDRWMLVYLICIFLSSFYLSVNGNSALNFLVWSLLGSVIWLAKLFPLSEPIYYCDLLTHIFSNFWRERVISL